MPVAASKSHPTGQTRTRRARRVSQAQKLVIFRDFVHWGLNERSYKDDTTSEQYMRIAKRADVWMLANRHRSIFSATFDDFKAFLFSCKPTARYRNHIRQALAAFLDYLVSESYRPDNPVLHGGRDGNGLPRLKEPKQLVHVPDRDVIKALWAEAKCEEPIVAALVGMLLWGGMRHNEVRTCTWPQIERDTILVEGKGDKQRRVPIHPELAWALRRWRGECTDPVLMFPSPRHPGQALSKTWVRTTIGGLGERVGFKCWPHLLRHSIATEIYDKSLDIRALQEFLGHASLQTTEIYVDVHKVRVKEAVFVANFENPD